MTSDLTNSHKIRKYLLRDLPEEPDSENIEQAMLADRSVIDEVECLETELIEDYLDHTLSPDDRRRFEKFFLLTPERQAKFRFMLALREKAAELAAEKTSVAAEYEAAPKRAVFLNDFFASGVFRFAAVALLAVVVGGGLWWYFAMTGKVDEGLAALNSAYKGRRPTEARLSNFDYAPAVTTRGDAEIPADENSVNKAGLLLISATEEKPSANSYRALGLYYATLHKFDEALRQFDAGAKFSPPEARFFSDHGAVLLEKAKSLPAASENRLTFLESSLSQLDTALKKDASFLPALFNRALCLEEMNSNAAAREAWQKYLEKDSTSEWAKEARQHLKVLDDKNSTSKTSAEVLNDFLAAFDRGDPREALRIAGETKEMITGTIVSDQLSRGFLSADAQGAPKNAERMLSALNFLGKLEKETNDDGFFLELAARYRDSTTADRVILVSAQNLVTEGYRLCQQAKLSEALEKFSEAQRQFARAGNDAEALRMNYWMSYCHQRIRLSESTRLAEELAQKSHQKGYKWLEEQALLQSASAYISQSRFSPAIRDNKKAIEIALAISDRYGSQKGYAQLADVYTQLNDKRPALENAQNGLREQGTYFNSPRQAWRNYLFASQASRRFGLGESAVAYALEIVSLARRLDDSAMLHDSFVYLSSAYRTVKDFDGSLKAADESFRLGDELDAGAVNERLLTSSLIEQAEAQRYLHNCPRSVETYQRAIEIFNKNEQAGTFMNYAAWKGKLLCHDELRQDDEIEAALPKALGLAENLRAQIEQEESRTSFFSDEQSVYEFAAAHVLKKGDDEAAFNFIEKSKARTLLDNLNSHSPGPPETVVLPLAEVRGRLPVNSQLVQFAVMPDKLYIWVVTGAEVRRFETAVSAEEIEQKVRDFSSLVSAASPDRRRLDDVSSALYSLLLQPIESVLDKQKTIAIIPDKTLCYLPFEPLRNGAGEFAIKNYQFVYAPSATLFVTLSEKASRVKNAAEYFVGVGNPTFDRDEFPDLSYLPAAEREIEVSASYYPKRKNFLAGKALKKDVLAAIPSAAVFHFAGHFVANELSPQFSKFLLAGDKSDGENYLSAADIGALKMKATHLVVLSACQTAIEDYYRGEGAIGAARTFFAAGVPLVVASRWKVDSSASSELMTAFHRNRKQRGLSAAGSLRAAQLELLENEQFNSPYYWAAFAAVGGL